MLLCLLVACCLLIVISLLSSFSPVSGTFPVLLQLPNGQTMPVAIPASITSSSVHIPTTIPVSALPKTFCQPCVSQCCTRSRNLIPSVNQNGAFFSVFLCLCRIDGSVLDLFFFFFFFFLQKPVKQLASNLPTLPLTL